MENFLNFLADPTVQIIGWTLGGIGWIFGIISGWLGIKSYSQQSKLEHGYIAILEQAQQDWQGKYTQEQIDSMTKELKRLEESINKDVPQKARRVFLEDQLSTLTESVTQGYNRYSEILVELKSNNQTLPDQVQSAIEQEIMPRYLEQQMQQKTTLSVLGVLGIILLVSNYYDTFAGLTFLFFLLATICFFVVINFSLEKQIKNFVNWIGRRTSLYLGIFLIVVEFLNWTPILKHSVGLFYSYIDSSEFLFVLMIESIFSAWAILLLFSRSQKSIS